MPAARAAPKTDSTSVRRTKATPTRQRPTFKLRMRVLSGETIAVGPGKIELLRAVQARQSISAAAKDLEMSYRRAWLLIDEMNRALKHPVVTTATGGAHGGGTQLTNFGRELVALYESIEARAHAACSDDIRRLLALVAR